MDIYAAGLVLYQAYNNGELPFNDEIQPGDKLPAPLYADYEIGEIILKACAPIPDDRWQDPTEMRQAIINYMQRNGAMDTPIVPMPSQDDPIPVDQEQITVTSDVQEISEIAQIDSKTQLLLDSVEFSQIVNFVPKDQVPSDRELFVIAEKLVSDSNGNKNFSQKLQHYCKQVAAVQDFTRIYLLYGIPVENDEFMQFYHHFISRRNVILACDAPSPSKLSDFCKLVCEESNISLDREDLLQQRKQIATKNDSLIKLVIQDKYE
jgi:hypothetical protein